MTVFLNTVVCRSDVLVWLQCVAPYVGSGCLDLILCPVTISSGETHVPIPNTLVKTWTADGSVLQWDVRVGDRRVFFIFSFIAFACLRFGILFDALFVLIAPDCVWFLGGFLKEIYRLLPTADLDWSKLKWHLSILVKCFYKAKTYAYLFYRQMHRILFRKEIV